MEIFAEKKLTIKVGDNISLVMNGSSGTTQLETSKFNVKVNGNMKYEATGNAEIEGASVSVNATSSMKLESSAAVKISGSPINLG